MNEIDREITQYAWRAYDYLSGIEALSEWSRQHPKDWVDNFSYDCKRAIESGKDTIERIKSAHRPLKPCTKEGLQ